jgi:hypothetical protein
MNYRILRVCGALSFSQEYYEIGGLGALCYEEQRNKFQTQNHPPPGSWSTCMLELGNESADVMIDFLPIQKQWCKENNVSIDFAKKEWMIKLLSAHIQVYQPDVLFFQAGCFTWFSSDERHELRAAFPCLKIITGQWGDELAGKSSYAKAFGNVDMVFTGTPAYQTKFEQAGIENCALGNCFDHILAAHALSPLGTQNIFDLTFIGYTGFGCDQHRQRYVDLVEIMQQTNLEIWTDEPDLKKTLSKHRPSLSSIVKWPIKTSLHLALRLMTDDQLERVREASWINWKLAKYVDANVMTRKGEPVRGQFYIDRNKISEMFPERCHRPLILGTEYYGLIGNSRISLNRHRDEKEDYGNLRVFEATGMGSCLVTDRGREMKDYFVADKEIVTYESSEEAIEKIQYLQDHEEERTAIAEAGKNRTLADHTVANRCQMIHEVVSKLI